MVVVCLGVFQILNGVKLDCDDPCIVTGDTTVVLFQYLGSLFRRPKAPPLLLTGIPESGGATKKASPSPPPLLPSRDMLKEKVVVKLAISPLALSHSGTVCTYCARPTLVVVTWLYLLLVSQSDSSSMVASPVILINSSRLAGLWGLVKLRLKDSELGRRRKWVAGIKKQQ
jgi:hypothetical protein